MAKKKIPTKSSFGSNHIDRINPVPTESMPKMINCTISFEEALKLHLAIGQALAKLNSYDRSTAEGKRTAMTLCIHTDTKRIRVLETNIRK